MLNRRVLILYWLVLLTHCVFQFYVLPYRAVTKPLLVPLLLTFLLLRDGNIAKPSGKAFFYIGLFLAFFGDVLLIIINDTFFISGMIAFMLMNFFYSASFLHLNRLRLRTSSPFIVSIAIQAGVACWIYGMLADDMGDYRMPVMIYLFSLIFMVGCAINIMGNKELRSTAIQFLVPGAVLFMLENILVAFNLFQFGKDKDVYIVIMLSYGTAQYLIVRGMQKAYPTVHWKK